MIAMIRTALVNRERERSAPERVQRAIEEQRHQSEKLIGWVQFAVVVTFATLYAVSPKTFAADVAFEPVPWALGGYLAFTLLRIARAHRERRGVWGGPQCRTALVRLRWPGGFVCPCCGHREHAAMAGRDFGRRRYGAAVQPHLELPPPI